MVMAHVSQGVHGVTTSWSVQMEQMREIVQVRSAEIVSDSLQYMSFIIRFNPVLPILSKKTD